MKKILFTIGMSLFFVFQPWAYAKTTSSNVHSSPPALSLSQQLNYIVNLAGTLDIGVEIKNLNTNQVIYSHNADQVYIPASNLKIFTAVAALEYLTPQFQYKTTITGESNLIRQGVYNGNLYVNFVGDPSLVEQDVNDLFKQLKQRGINEITGNIYINDALFDQNGAVPAALAEDATYCFAAPVTADTIDHNCVGILVEPTGKAGHIAAVNVMESVNAVNIINEVVIQYNKKCLIHATVDDNNHYVLDGCINKKTGAQQFSLPAQNTRAYTLGVIKGALAQAKIQFNGRYDIAIPPAGNQVLALHLSDPLSLLIKHMLKESDNLYANAILKTLGARYFKAVGSWQNGTEAVKAILQYYNHVDLSSAVLVDGAGLSRLNQISAAQMIQVLSSTYYNPIIINDFIKALPIAGLDGTLKHRLLDASFKARVHAKTGTMSNISSLSGYLVTHKNQTLAFAIFINGSDGYESRYRKIEDNICKLLILQV